VSALKADETAALKRELDERGYVVIRGVVDKERLGEYCVATLEDASKADKFEGGGKDPYVQEHTDLIEAWS